MPGLVYLAASVGDHRAIEGFHSGFEWSDEDGSTPLMISVMNDDIQTTRALLDKGANVSALNKRGRTVLSMARTVPMVRILLEYGADLNAYVYGSITEVMAAQTPQIAALLVHRGADIHLRSKHGNRTALASTILSHRSSRLTRNMIAHGADVQAADDYGWSAINSMDACGMKIVMDGSKMVIKS